MQVVSRHAARRLIATAASIALVAGLAVGTTALASPAAAAAPAAKSATAKSTAAKASTVKAAATSTPATVSDDALPTVQVNGVVWAQVTVGNTVYATGSFTQTWPSGQTASSTNQTARSNLLAYDITTGNLITSFNHSLNAQGLGLAVSPDGSTVYVVGDFTTVDGVTRNHIAAFSTATGNLTSFAPSIGGSTAAVAVTASTVYVGGNFFSVGGVARTRLAAFNTSGTLLSWAPTADNNKVNALVVSPDGTRVIVAGQFTTLNGVSAIGMGAVDATSGASVAWAVNQTIQDGFVPSNNGAGCGITSLSTDGNLIYGTGYSYYCGNFEGRFAANANTGAITWVNDCHGDTYDAVPIGQVLYSVGHAHDCSAIGGFPDTNPRTWHRALAETTYATGTDSGPDSYGWNYSGLPDSTQLDWYPNLSAGTYTGQSQAAWSVTGNSNYISLGGEFPSVNGVAQSGLTRFAVRSLAPNKVGPQVYGTNWKVNAVSLSAGSVRVSFPSNWDPDDPVLTYKVYRDSTTSAPVYTTTGNSRFWLLPTLGFTDTGLAQGSTHQYKVVAIDPYGNQVSSAWVSVTVNGTGVGATSTYAKDVLGDGATDYWRLDEGSGSTAYDSAGFDDMTENNGVTQGAPGPISGDPGTASTFNGSNQFAATSDQIAGPNTFSIEGWFNTTSTSGGMIAGFGNSNSGTSSAYDRHIYMDSSGHLYFGVYNNAVYNVSTAQSYNDGSWHYVVGELSSAGVQLYVDGKLVGTNSGTTTGQAYNGYWRIGGDNLNGWPNASGSYFGGSIADVAVYPSALSAAQVRTHFLAAGGSIPGYLPAPNDTYGKTVYGDGPSNYYRMDESSGPNAVDASGNGNGGTYYGNETFGASSPVTGGSGSAVTFSGTNGSTLSSNQQQVGPSTYSEELWFNTTTTNGGKLIGFGDQQSGLSGNYDRQVYMTNNGQIIFGVFPGSFQTITSPNSYNDGKWHYLVATQGANGMNLYIDDQLIGSNPTTSAQGYNGYWRIGGDNLGSWPSQPNSNWFAGTIDEAAVYPVALTAAQVDAHYSASALAPAAPVASFTSSVNNLSASFDGSGSTSGGTITGYAWNFGDGSSGTGVTPNHAYAVAGTYTVTLTVTDSNNRTATVSNQVTVTAPNQPPVAVFTSSCNGATCAFDASGSYDPDGTVASYAWNFGDGSSGTGKTVSHAYTTAGSYTVTLTVTDNSGATNATTATVNPTAVYASDAFQRTVASGWGTADTGGAWSAGSSSSVLSVSPGAGTLTVNKAGGVSSAYLPSVSTTNSDTTAVVTPSANGTSGGTYADVIARRVSSNSDYRVRVHLLANGTVGLALLDNVSGTQTVLKSESIVKGLTFTPGTTSLTIRVQAFGSGTTTLRAMVWATGATAPTAWQASVTDSTAALQAAGSVGLSEFVPASTTNVPLSLKFSKFLSQSSGN